MLVRRAGEDGAPPPNAADFAIVEMDPLSWAERTWTAAEGVRRLLGEPWGRMGPGDVLPVPGLTDLAWWGTLREVWRMDRDVAVVDAGPVAQATQWLTLPDTVVGLLRRVWPLAQRTGDAAGLLEAGSWHLRAMARLDSEAAELAAQVRSPGTSVHLVTGPRPHELGRVLRALAPMALFELPVTDLLVNRVDQGGATGAAIADRLREHLPSVAVRTASEHSMAPDAASVVLEAYPDLAPGKRTPRPKMGRDGEEYLWRWWMPFADQSAVSAAAQGDNLVLTVRQARRVVPLPSVLRRCDLIGATLRGSALTLRFAPDLDVWPKGRESS